MISRRKYLLKFTKCRIIKGIRPLKAINKLLTIEESFKRAIFPEKYYN